MSDSATTERPAEKKDRSHDLYCYCGDRRSDPPELAEHPLPGHPTAQPLK